MWEMIDPNPQFRLIPHWNHGHRFRLIPRWIRLRIDRLGAKAETCGKPIRVYIPYLEGCQDEKLFRVVMDRERWFGVVMGADQAMAKVLKAGAWELERMGEAIPAPPEMLDGLALKLSVSA